MKVTIRTILFASIFSSKAFAGILDDEIRYKMLLICGETYRSKENIVYEKDKKELSEISLGFNTDLTKKYSKYDVDLMTGKALVESRGMGIDKSKYDPVDICRKILKSINDQKNQTGTYISKD